MAPKDTPQDPIWSLPVEELLLRKKMQELERANNGATTPEELQSRLNKVDARAADDDFSMRILDVLDRPAELLAQGGALPGDMRSSDAMSDVERAAYGKDRYYRDAFGDVLVPTSEEGVFRKKPTREELNKNLGTYFESTPPGRNSANDLRVPVSLDDIGRALEVIKPVYDARTGVDLSGDLPVASRPGEALPQGVYTDPEDDPTTGYAKGYRLSRYQLHEDTTPIGRPVPENGTRYLYADRDSANMQLENALRRLGIKQQLADVVRWNKQKSSATRKDPRAALGALAGLSESDDRLQGSAAQAYNEKLAAIAKQAQEDTQRMVQVGGDDYYVPTGTSSEMEYLRGLTQASTDLADIAKRAKVLSDGSKDVHYKEKLRALQQQAMHILTNAGKQGAISKDELAQYEKYIPVGYSDAIINSIAPNLELLSDVLEKRAKEAVSQRGGKPSKRTAAGGFGGLYTPEELEHRAKQRADAAAKKGGKLCPKNRGTRRMCLVPKTTLSWTQTPTRSTPSPATKRCVMRFRVGTSCTLSNRTFAGSWCVTTQGRLRRWIQLPRAE